MSIRVFHYLVAPLPSNYCNPYYFKPFIFQSVTLGSHPNSSLLGFDTIKAWSQLQLSRFLGHGALSKPLTKEENKAQQKNLSFTRSNIITRLELTKWYFSCLPLSYYLLTFPLTISLPEPGNLITMTSARPRDHSSWVARLLLVILMSLGCATGSVSSSCPEPTKETCHL